MGAGGGVDATETASFPDWSRLPLDPLLVVMAALEAPDLVRSGGACSSWRAAYATVRRLRIPTAESPPCLFYPRADDAAAAGGDTDAATIFNPATGASFRVRLPDPPLRRRSLHGSGHGWLVAADEASNLHLVNPLTGAQHALPPVTGLHNTELAHSDEQGNPMYNVYEVEYLSTEPEPLAYAASELRLYMYFKAVLSCSPCAGSSCVVLLLHQPDGELSFARLGDEAWTWIGGDEYYDGEVDGGEDWLLEGYRDAVYNEKDGLFYVLGYGADIITLDLKGNSPVVKKIMKDVTNQDDLTKYLVITPWGDLLQVWRMTDSRSSTTQVQRSAEGMEDCDVGIGMEDSDVEVPEDPNHELCTEEIQLYKVDIDNQKLVRITSLGDYALFLGLNSTMILSTKDFPTLKADSAYLAHDNLEDILIHTYSGKEIGIWNFRSGTLEVVDNVHSWQNWPVPIWITPSLC
ncbi:unnamed protein product [Urochloa decumbens]|uniref:KIB1-4 beta-propeller domain-containing protein n=1 Tax=Urochloa decumbens TaxID=240449 RepID=A0ABC9BDU6_9POAL